MVHSEVRGYPLINDTDIVIKLGRVLDAVVLLYVKKRQLYSLLRQSEPELADQLAALDAELDSLAAQQGELYEQRERRIS